MKVSSPAPYRDAELVPFHFTIPVPLMSNVEVIVLVKNAVLVKTVWLLRLEACTVEVSMKFANIDDALIVAALKNVVDPVNPDPIPATVDVSCEVDM